VPTPAPGKPGFMQRRSTRVFAGLTALAVVGGLGAWVIGHGKESTDDAQVEGRVVSVSPRVGGQVEKVLVTDNQQVKQGDLLVQLDTKDLDAKLASARADLEAAKAGLASAQVNLKLTQAPSPPTTASAVRPAKTRVERRCMKPGLPGAGVGTSETGAGASRGG